LAHVAPERHELPSVAQVAPPTHEVPSIVGAVIAPGALDVTGNTSSTVPIAAGEAIASAVASTSLVPSGDIVMATGGPSSARSRTLKPGAVGALKTGVAGRAGVTTDATGNPVIQASSSTPLPRNDVLLPTYTSFPSGLTVIEPVV
jgi:hypothetical protein